MYSSNDSSNSSDSSSGSDNGGVTIFYSFLEITSFTIISYFKNFSRLIGRELDIGC